MTADDDAYPGHGAVVRKPPGKEPAGFRSQRSRTHYGDFDAALAEVVAGNVGDEPILNTHDIGTKLGRGGEASRTAIGAWRACRDTGSDERHRGWRWTSETARHGNGG